MQRLGECARDGPAKAKASENRVARQAELFRPLRHVQGQAVMGQPTIAPRVVALLLTAGPSAVSRLVVAVIVDAVNRVAGRARPHVGEEILEARKPTVTDCDSARSVKGVVVISRIEASLPDVVVDPVFGRSGRAVSREQFTMKASTGPGVSVFQLVSGNDALLSTSAPAMPAGALSARRADDYRQALEHLPGQVHESRRRRFPLKATARAGIAAPQTSGFHCDASAAVASAKPVSLLPLYLRKALDHSQAGKLLARKIDTIVSSQCDPPTITSGQGRAARLTSLGPNSYYTARGLSSWHG